MMKHAYLILAHDDLKMLNILLKRIDNINADIFIHLDLNYHCNQNDIIADNIKYSKVYFVKREKSSWGSIGIVYGTINLLIEASKHGYYDYYHLLSGHDLPIKNNDEINDFFENNVNNNYTNNLKTNYVNYYNNKANYINRYIHYNYLITSWRSKNVFIKLVAKVLNIIGHSIQNLFKENRFNDDLEYLSIGSEWWSISNELFDAIINNIDWIKEHYDQHSFAADESFMQTFVNKFGFKDTLYRPIDKQSSNLREIIFDDINIASPYIFKEKDLDYLKDSNNLFARKFSTSVDVKIIEDIIK